MTPSEIQNAKLGAETLNTFLDQFQANDPQSQIVLEYIFELLFKKSDPND